MKWIVLLCVIGCLSNGCNTTNTNDTKNNTLKPFKHAQVPGLLTDPDDRAVYLAKNYWKHFDFADTAYINQPEITEQAFADYLNLLTRLKPETTATSIQGTLSKAQADSAMYRYFVDMFEKYLYNPNSPFRNETLYIQALGAIVNDPYWPEHNKEPYRYQLELALKNRPRMPATDFSYSLHSGKTGTLYGINAPYLILLINNPGCNACKEITRQITQSDIIQRLIRMNKLKILCIYPDQDEKAWKEYATNAPQNWIHGYDHQHKLRNDELYDLRAIPTLYLLDQKKHVILKDANFQTIENYFLTQENMTQEK